MVEPSARPNKRARRLEQRNRMIARAYRVIRANMLREHFDDDWARDWAVRNHDHLAVCSCALCANPRRTLGEPTVQERRRDRIDRLDGQI